MLNQTLHCTAITSVTVKHRNLRRQKKLSQNIH